MKKIQHRRQTIFIYCEGKTDALFVQHLKKLYLLRGTKHVTIKPGTGGDPYTLISKIENNAQVRDYDEKYIVLDSDDKNKEELQKIEKSAQAKDKDIELIWQKPCLEGVFLRILNNEIFIKEKSECCKSKFNKIYTPDNTHLSEKLLEELFTKNILDSKRQEIQELNWLITLMEEKITN